jgi:two-component system chemotaxis response regulator CheB
MLSRETDADPPGSPAGSEIVVIASSAGGLSALCDVLGSLPAAFPLPILVARHLSPSYPSRLATVLGWHTRLSVKWAEDGELLHAGTVYVCPPNRQLALTAERSLALTKITNASRFRPSADLLFESAALIYGAGVTGVVLSGVLNDGARGAAAINGAGGITMAQCELSSEFFEMPSAAIDFGRAELIASPAKLGAYLKLLGDMVARAPDTGNQLCPAEAARAHKLRSTSRFARRKSSASEICRMQ